MSENKRSLEAEITDRLSNNPVLLFMKGDRVFPQCGFSARVVEILDSLGVNYQTFDILTDDSMRQALKEYSNWPTFPQLYVKSELIGGCDIITDMAQSGELKQVLIEKGVMAA